MGISTGCALVVGLPCDEFENEFIYDCEHDQGYEALGMERISPYYDAGSEDCLFGFVVTNQYWGYSELSEESLQKIPALKQKFRDVTDQEPKLYVSPHVS